MSRWPFVANADEIPSPALIVFVERVESNIAHMLALAGGPQRLWPHIKTHKLPQIVRMQAALGITRCKCATIAEAEMAADNGAREILLAQQPVGPNVTRLLALTRLFPEVEFLTLIDDEGAARALSKAAESAGCEVSVLLDLDVGMGRTGVPADARAVGLYRAVATMPGLRLGGLHAYDGQLSHPDVEERRRACDAAFAPVAALRKELEQLGLPVPRVIAGGTPTFAFHAANPAVECSPGTSVLWDAGYGKKLADLPFEPAAVLLTRVVSKPGANRLCLDLGHKAVASEMTPPRAIFPELPDAQAVTHSEEHLVLETGSAAQYRVGDVLYAIPWHVCPTVALHAEAWIVRGEVAEERWPVVGRSRHLTV